MYEWRLQIVTLIAVLGGCRAKVSSHMDEAPRLPPNQVEVPLLVELAGPPAPIREPVALQPEPISGFNFKGSATCLPLAADRSCLRRVDPLEAACRAVQGQVLYCEDCSPLCSRLVNH